MEIGSTSEQVTVTADVPLLEQRCGLGHVALLLQEWNLASSLPDPLENRRQHWPGSFRRHGIT